MNIKNSSEKIASEFIQSFASGNYEKMQSTLAADVQSYITNAEGGVNLLDGRDAFMRNIYALDAKSVKPQLKITQMLTVKQNQVMLMVEIKAKRKEKSLHNFAAYLIDIKDDLISEIRMVEALPAYSDEFWKS